MSLGVHCTVAYRGHTHKAHDIADSPPPGCPPPLSHTHKTHTSHVPEASSLQLSAGITSGGWIHVGMPLYRPLQDKAETKCV